MPAASHPFLSAWHPFPLASRLFPHSARPFLAILGQRIYFVYLVSLLCHLMTNQHLKEAGRPSDDGNQTSEDHVPCSAGLRLHLTSSSPGLDGFRPALYHAFWSVIEGAIRAFLEAFHRGDAELEGINQAHVVLLPKKNDVIMADDFRLISLQYCALKRAAKVLTNRVRGVIPSLISMLQTSFAKGCSITNNFLLAAELL